MIKNDMLRKMKRTAALMTVVLFATGLFQVSGFCEQMSKNAINFDKTDNLVQRPSDA